MSSQTRRTWHKTSSCMNETLKTKWLWRFAKEDDAMWKNMIKGKYGIESWVGGVKRALILTVLIVENLSWQ